MSEIASKKKEEKFEYEFRDQLKYRKRKGTTDLAKLYEEYFPANLILKLLQNKNVKDFRISTNDDRFGAFDDLVVDIEHINGFSENYGIQLKHKENPDASIKNFNVDRHFSILNFYRSFQQCNELLLSNYKLILFTNAKFTADDNTIVDLGKDKESVKVKIIECAPFPDFKTTDDGKSYKFCLDPENSEENTLKYKGFLDRFFLYTNQVNVQRLKHENIPRSLGMLTSSDLCAPDKFLRFIFEWSVTDGIKEKLTKDLTIKVITLHIIEELIHPHSFCEVSEQKKLLQKAVSHFNITVFNRNILAKVVKIWGDAKSKLRNGDLKMINDILKQYQISTKLVQNIDDLTDQELTKLLWVMDECPLIIKEHPAAYEAAKLCGEKSKFVFIIDELLDNKKMEQLTVFKTLSDLKYHASTYEELLSNLTFTLFEEKMCLGNLIQEDNAFENLITTDEIVKITDEPRLIRLEDEKLCVPYIERHLYKIIISNQYLRTLDDNTMVLISSVNDEDKFKLSFQSSEIVSITDNTDSRKKIPMTTNGSSNKCKLFVSKSKTSREEFINFCNNNRKYQKFHHLRYNGIYLEWLESIGDVSDLQQFCIKDDRFVDDEKMHLERIQSNLNIIIGGAGMGKSVFAKQIKNNLLSKYFALIILPTDVLKLTRCIEHSEDLQKVFTVILESIFPNFGNFQKRVLKLLMQKGKVVFLWDALDELSEPNRIFVEQLIITLSENTVAQFITSRAFMRNQLENKFNVLCQELQPFHDEEQTGYILARLKDNYFDETLEDVIATINKNVAGTLYRDILGVPLQIFMITELFRQNPDKYVKLFKELFVITDLYSHLIEEKFHYYFKLKKHFPDDYDENIFVQKWKSERLRCYQIVAVKLLFGSTLSVKLNNKEYDDFLTELQENGDVFGLITDIDINKHPKFLHNTYAEYFAASYLAENWQNVTNLEKIIFDRKYTNIRYFFDLILAKNSPVHIAVLCKNLEYIQNCKDKDNFQQKDLLGRNPLHLAASWGEKYPILETSKSGHDSTTIGTTVFINNNIHYETKKENAEYYQIMDVLLRKCDANEEDQLFNFTPTMYAEKSECIFAAAIIEKKQKNLNYLETKDRDFVCSLLYYSIKYSFQDIVELFVNIRFFALIDKRNSLLHMTVENNQLQYLSKLLEQEVYRRNIDYRNMFGETPLLTAAENGYIEIVKYLTKYGANVNTMNSDGSTPLLLIAQNGHIETMKYLIKHNADVKMVDKYGATILHLAAQNGHLDIVEYLIIEENVKVNAVDNYGKTPLHVAVLKRHVKIVKYLVEQNAEVNVVDSNGWTPLYLAAFNGELETVEFLIQENADVNAVNKEGATALHIAAEKGYLDIVKYLIQKKVNINATDNKGATPLYLATENGHIETAKYLIKFKSNVNATDNSGATPLHIAVKNGHMETVEYLTTQNANINAVNSNGETPLHIAAFNGHLATVQYLTKQNAIVDARDSKGYTSLMIAAGKGRGETVKYLLQQNVNVNAVADNGATALHLAARTGDLETIENLNQQNPIIDLQMLNGFTPLMVAAEKGHFETVKYLIEQNADVNAKNNDGWTPLYVAALNGHFDVVKYLAERNAIVDAADSNGFTPLMMASQEGHIDTIKYLVQQKNANVNTAAKNGETSLYLATLNGHLQTVIYLKQQNAKFDAPDKDGFTPLMWAAQNGNLDTTKYLLIQQKRNVNAFANNGATSIYLAACYGHIETVEYLTNMEAKVDKVANNGLTPLMAAAQNGHVKTVKYLIQKTANVNATAITNDTALHLAAKNGHFATVRCLLQETSTININAVNNYGKTALHVTVEKGHFKIMEHLIQKNANINAKDKYGKTPLHAAAEYGHIETVKYLIQNNASVNAIAEDDTAPLHLAADKGHLETLQYLIQKGANVNAAKNDGWTPLHLAADSGHHATVLYLIQQHANVNAVTNKRWTPLYLAAENGHLEAVKYLIQEHAKVNVITSDDWTPLHAAAKNGHLETVKFLIQKKANVNANDKDGTTPLHAAAGEGYYETVKYLIQKNADVNAIDSNGWTPLHAPALGGHLDTVKYLVQNNAKINAIAKDGTTPLHLATKNRHLDTVKYLTEHNAQATGVDIEGFTPQKVAER